MDENGLQHTRGCPRSFAELRYLLGADLHRYAGRTGLKPFLRHYAFTPGFKCTVWIRLTGYLLAQPAFRRTLYPVSKLLLLRYRVKYGIAIPEYTVIGPGFFINRFGGIYVHGDAVIGANVNFTHGTVLGMMNRGKRPGAPVLGDRVFFGAGAMAAGGVRIGHDAAVGARALVTRDVPDGVAVGGNPAKPLSNAGSAGYINRQADVSDYEARFGPRPISAAPDRHSGDPGQTERAEPASAPDSPPARPPASAG